MQEMLQKNQSADAPGLAFVPSDRPTAEVRRSDASDPQARRPSLDTTEYRNGVKGADGVDIPIEELRLLASHSGAGGYLSAKCTSRLRVGLLIAGLVAVAALLGWQHRGDEVKQMARGWSSSLASHLSASPISSPRVSIVERETIAASQLDARGADTSEQTPDRVAGTAGELQQQLEAIGYNLSVMKQSLEQLAAKQAQLAAQQEQVSRDIASLRAVKQDDKLNTASARPLRSVAVPPRKKTADLPPPPPIPRPLSSDQASSEPQQEVVVRPPRPPR